jgi:lipopolysaccharide/colanic/teichoic acid biosynthesis glycosyltransferase
MKQAGIPLLVKRVVDRSVALGVLVAATPVLGIAAVAVRIGMGRPVLFTQSRPGLHGRPFRIYKMRTMSDARDANGQPRPDAERLTPLGKLLRATSIDELPQLWNVLRGELSLVGPRPLMTEYLPYYAPDQARRHDVVPGITGWAQVHGRNSISWEEKLALDVWYVDHWSPWLDLRILAKTAYSVIRREGIAPAGHATMPRFDDHVRGTTAPLGKTAQPR